MSAYKILHINTFDSGGAANACIRLHRSLLEIGLDSKLLTLVKKRTDIPQHYSFEEIFNGRLNKLNYKIRSYLFYKNKVMSLKGKPEHFEIFSTHISPINILKHKLVKEADILNLHWIAEFVNYKSFFRKMNKKIVWTLHDMNPFTGGCHYASNCEKFKTSCTECFQLAGIKEKNLAKDIFLAKDNVFSEKLNLTLVCLSSWMKKMVDESLLFSKYNKTHIQNGIDPLVFKNTDKQVAREILKLPKNKNVILFISDSIQNHRKGLSILQNALNDTILKSINDHVLCTVGSGNPESGNTNYFHLGKISDEKVMALIYSASDVFIIPAIEDNLPNTVIESLLCGTPVIGFNIGGIPDMIKNEFNGLLCEKTDHVALAKTILYFFEIRNIFNPMEIMEDAKSKYASKIQAENYLLLYKSILNQK